MRHVVFILFYPNEQRAGGGGGVLPDFSFPCSADHEWDWPPYKVVFRVGNQYAECEKQYTVYCILYSYSKTKISCFPLPGTQNKAKAERRGGQSNQVGSETMTFQIRRR